MTMCAECVAVCCSVLQCVAVCCRHYQDTCHTTICAELTAKERFFSAKDQCVFAKEPCYSAKEPCSSAQDPSEAALKEIVSDDDVC